MKHWIRASLDAIDRRLARRYLPAIQCPECLERVAIPHRLEVHASGEGEQTMTSTPDESPMWNHWAKHLGVTND